MFPFSAELPHPYWDLFPFMTFDNYARLTSCHHVLVPLLAIIFPFNFLAVLPPFARFLLFVAHLLNPSACFTFWLVETRRLWESGEGLRWFVVDVTLLPLHGQPMRWVEVKVTRDRGCAPGIAPPARNAHSCIFCASPPSLDYTFCERSFIPYRLFLQVRRHRRPLLLDGKFL